MDDLIQSLGMLAPFLLGLASWLVYQFRESQWAKRLAGSLGFSRREYEQDWEYHRRVGSYWISIAFIAGVVVWIVAQQWLETAPESPVLPMAALIVAAVVFVWSLANAIRALRGARRDF